MTATKPLDIDLSLKKNNVDEFFFNLSENPEGFKNKDFRYTLSLIYQLVEDEFEGIFYHLIHLSEILIFCLLMTVRLKILNYHSL